MTHYSYVSISPHYKLMPQHILCILEADIWNIDIILLF